MKALFCILCCAVCLSACQSIKTPNSPIPIINQENQPVTAPNAVAPDVIAFDISGKISLISQNSQGKKATTAFYHWVQDDQQFAIDLTGAFGIGATSIRFDGQMATLSTNGQTLSAKSPNELLHKATGLFAPIDKLPHWIMGQVADGDTNSQFDGQRLSQSTNSDWTAVFDYDDKAVLPKRLRLSHQNGHKLTLLIDHKAKP